MSKVSRFITAAMLIMLMLLSFNTSVEALSCAEKPSVKEEMQASELVFKGIVSGQTKQKVQFHVTKVWKGDVGPRLTLAQEMWIPFEDGEEYIVFASDYQGELQARLCGNTSLAAGLDENALGASIPITAPAISDFWKGFMIGMGVTLVIAGAVILGWMYRKKRRTSI